MPFLHILLLGFSGAVIAVWFKHHFVMLPDNQLSIGLPFIICAAISLLFGFFLFRKMNIKNQICISWRPISCLLVVFFFGLLIFNTQAFLRGLFLSHEPLIPLTNLLTANTSFVTKFAAVILVFTVLTFAFYSAGNLLLRIILRSFISDTSAYAQTLRIMLGMLVWSLFLLGLGFLEALTARPIWTAFILLLIAEHRAIKDFLKELFAPRKLEWSKRSPELYLLFLVSFLVAFTLTQSIRPHPTGYDDMTFYMDRVHLISSEHLLVSGGLPYPFELIASAVNIASANGTLFLGMSFATYSLFLGALILSFFGKDIFTPRTGIIAATILLSLPIGAALTFREVKPDALLFPVSAFLLWSLIKSIQKKDLTFWYISLGLFSFAVTVKLTALFLLAPIAITGLTLIKLHSSIIQFSWHTAIIVSLLWGALPITGWIGYGLTTHPLPSLSEIDYVLSTVAPDEGTKFRSEIYRYSVEQACSATGATEDFSRFIPNRNPIERWVTLPWDLTMNLSTGSFATEIGFFFLALLPFWLVVRRKFESPLEEKWFFQPISLIAFFALGYFFLWIWRGQGVMWYGYPGLALLILLVALLEAKLKNERILYVFFWIALLLGLTANTLVQMKLKAERAQVLFSAGELSAADFLEQSIAGYGGALTILNQDPSSRVILTSSQLWYGLVNNDERAIMDAYLDTFNCLHRERDDALTLSRLREFDVRYILYARGYTAELHNGKRESFNEKIRVFTDFLGKNLQVVWGSPYYTLFEVPTETSSPSRR